MSERRFDGVPLKPGHLWSSGLGSADRGNYQRERGTGFVTRVINSIEIPLNEGITSVNLGDDPGIID